MDRVEKSFWSWGSASGEERSGSGWLMADSMVGMKSRRGKGGVKSMVGGRVWSWVCLSSLTCEESWVNKVSVMVISSSVSAKAL